MTCGSTLPPRTSSGFGGGFPGAGSSYYLVREPNVGALRAAGQLALPERLQGRREVTHNKLGHMTMNRDDVLGFVSGGGDGLGDPLLRDRASVVADLAAGWITAGHARAAYGVLVDAHGALDEPASDAAREALRRARLGAPPRRALYAPASVGVAVTLSEAGDRWLCASCDETLGASSDNWRDIAVVEEIGISERFAALEMNVRARSEDPAVVLREHYCPSCAAALVVDVVVVGTPVLPAPRVARATATARRVAASAG